MKKMIILLAVAVLCGCTYVAKPMPMKVDMVSSFASSATVKIINAQTTGITGVENGGQKVNLRDTTEAAITLLKEELSNNGVTHDEAAEKTLAISIDSVALANLFTPFTVGCNTSFTVTTGDGYSKKILTHNKSGVGLNYACDFAITKAIAEILNDPRIRSYLDAKEGPYL